MWSIKTILENKLLKEQDERKTKERSGKWNPSSLGQCYRRQYWNRLNIPQSNPPDVRTLSIFKVGNLFEEFVFSLMPLEIERQVKTETTDCLGYADGVFENEVIELKTQHSRKFWHVNKEKNETQQQGIEFSITQHNPEHIMQAGFYAVTLGKEFIRLIYISKDDLCIDEYQIKMTDEIKKKIEDEFKTLNYYWDKKELPPAVPRLYPDKKLGGFKECQYCFALDFCKQTELKRKGEK